LENSGYRVFVPSRISTSGIAPNVWYCKRDVKTSTKEAYDAQFEFDRNWYVKVNSQEEADAIFDWLESKGEKIGNRCIGTTDNYLRKDLYEDTWRISGNTGNKPEKQLSDILPDYKSKVITPEPKESVKKQYNLSTTITRAVKEDNPNLIFEEFGITEITGLKESGCMVGKFNIGYSNCKGLGCNIDNCPFIALGGKTVESAKAWLYRDRAKSFELGMLYPYTSGNNDSRYILGFDPIEEPKDFANPVIVKSKKQKRNKLIIVNN
jgi:hypothetical protein